MFEEIFGLGSRGLKTNLVSLQFLIFCGIHCYSKFIEHFWIEIVKVLAKIAILTFRLKCNKNLFFFNSGHLFF